MQDLAIALISHLPSLRDHPQRARQHDFDAHLEQEYFNRGRPDDGYLAVLRLRECDRCQRAICDVLKVLEAEYLRLNRRSFPAVETTDAATTASWNLWDRKMVEVFHDCTTITAVRDALLMDAREGLKHFEDQKIVLRKYSRK